MSKIHFEIKDRENIEALGLKYADNEEKCYRHFINNVWVPFSLNNIGSHDLSLVDKELDKVFSNLIIKEVKYSSITHVREITWDRIFLFKNWNINEFAINFWIRIVGMSSKVEKLGTHVMTY